MRLKLFSLFHFFFTIPSSLFSLTYDFHFGGGLGLQNNQYVASKSSAKSYFDVTLEGETQTVFYDTEVVSDFIWSGSAFLGAGLSFGRSAIGLEYSVNYISDSLNANVIDARVALPQAILKDPDTINGRIKSGETIVVAKANRHTQNLQHFLDSYYKVTLSKKLAIDLQFNLGLSVKQILVRDQSITTHKDYLSIVLADNYTTWWAGIANEKFTNHLPSYGLRRNHSFQSFLGLGLHTGFRLSFSMLYLALDYSYTPNFYLNGQLYDEDYGNLNCHGASLSIGLIFNKTIIDSLFSK